MRQQLRLRVLLPVAVLGLLGAGFGAYATGRPPEPPPVAPPAATATDAEPTPTRPGAVSPKVWAKRLEALCVTADANVLHTVAELRTAEDAEAYLVAIVDVHRWLDPELAELGWPKGEKAAVAGLRADLERSGTLASAGLRALEAENLAKLDRLLLEAKRLDGRIGNTLRRLGAETCLDTSKAAAKRAENARQASPPRTALARALSRYRAAVVVFYTPGGKVDTAAIREARAAALEADVGFLALNAAAEGTVAKLAQDYDVFAAPAVLVFVRGPKVASQFGYADRNTVAQAVANALR